MKKLSTRLTAVTASIVVVLIASVLFFIGRSGPIGPVPGGALKGVIGTPPSDWAFAATAELIQLETLGADQEPHSVNIWFAVVGGRLYVPTSLVRGAEEPGDRTWVKNATTNPQVRIRIDGNLYPGVMSRLTESTLLDTVKKEIIKKYVTEPDARSANAWIFEIKDPTDGKNS